MQAPFLTESHQAFRERVRAQLRQIVLPHAERWEAQGHIPREAWRALAQNGLLNLGHSGEDFLYSAIFLDELGGTGYAGIRAAIGVHAYMALSYLELFGTPEQRGSYLADARAGERIAALAISEAQAGSDLRHLSSYAEPRDGGYRVTGQKCHVANGSQADFFITLVKTRNDAPSKGLTGASLLIIDADTPGVRRTPVPMLGWHSADVCHIDLDNVWVPADSLIGRRDKALLYLMQGLDFERLVAGLLATGGARHCLAAVNRFVRQHQVKDAPLSANQAIRQRLADLSGELELIRHYAYHAAWRHSRNTLDTRTASVLKLKATELALAAAQTCVQYHGARGYQRDAMAARIYRDAMAGTLAAGASELMRELIFETDLPGETEP